MGRDDRLRRSKRAAPTTCERLGKAAVQRCPGAAAPAKSAVGGAECQAAADPSTAAISKRLAQAGWSKIHVSSKEVSGSTSRDERLSWVMSRAILVAEDMTL
eukprot:4307836-Amphidinium_carterae.1